GGSDGCLAAAAAWQRLVVLVVTAVVRVVLASVVVVAVAEKRRVRESGVDDRVDRETRNLFGFAGKIPPEKFSGGGGWWPAGGGEWERVLSFVCVYLIIWNE
nr:hypothetical protein [Tanacetum cinerariifolium]